MRDSVYVRIDSVNLLYLIIDNKVDGFIKYIFNSGFYRQKQKSIDKIYRTLE